MRAVLALPLLQDDRVIGALSIEDELSRTFDAEAMALVWLFAAQAATALANAQLYTEVQTGQGAAGPLPQAPGGPEAEPDCP